MIEHRKVRMLMWPPLYPGLCVDLDGEDYIIESIESDPEAVIKVNDIGRQVAWDLGRDSYEPMPLMTTRQTVLVSLRLATPDQIKAWADNEASEFEDSRRIQRGQSIRKKLIAR